MISFLLRWFFVAVLVWLAYNFGYWRARVRYTEKIERLSLLHRAETLNGSVSEAMHEPLVGPRPPFSLFGKEEG